MPENPSDPNPNPRTHRRKKNIEHIITLSTIISTHLKNWPHVALYAIIATIVVVYVYKYDIIASIALSTIFTATPLILHITFPSSQIFSKVRRNRRKNDLLEEINTRTEENADDRRIGYNSFGPQHSSQELPREEIQVKAFDSAPAYYDTAIVEPRSSHSTRPELAAGFISISGLTAWGASRRGRSHINNNTPRQDSFSIRAIPDGLVAAVADGVGSTEFAERASEAAVAACTGFNWFAPRSEDDWNDEVMKAIDSMCQAIISAVGNLPYNEKRPPSTTIAAAIVTRSSRGCMLDWFSIGDSAIMIIPFDGSGQIDTINKAPLANSPATEALPRLFQGSLIERGHGVCIDLNSSTLVLATDGCFKPMHQCPGPYIQNFSNIVHDVADASHLLAAIRQDGVGHADDSTAILISATRG